MNESVNQSINQPINQSMKKYDASMTSYYAANCKTCNF